MFQDSFNLNRKYIIGLFTFIVILVGAFVFLKTSHGKAELIAETINKSGKQRMLSQRLTLLAIKHYESNEKLSTVEYENTIEIMFQNHNYLLNNIEDKKIKEYYLVNPNLNKMTLDFIELNRKLLKNPSKIILNKIKSSQNELLKKLDIAVSLYEEKLNKAAGKFENTMLVTLILLLIFLLLQSKYIFYPLLKKFRSLALNIQKDKEIFETLLANATDGIHILDKNGNILMCSNSFASMLGYTKDEILKLNIKDWNATDEVLNNNYLENKMSKEQSYETVHKKKDGTIIPVQATVKPIVLNNTDYYYASTRDISNLINERKKKAKALDDAKAAEEEAILSQEHLEEAQHELLYLNQNLEFKVRVATKELNHNLDVINKYIITSKTDLAGNIVEVSDKFCEISKYSREELIGQNHRIVKHSDMPVETYKELWQTISNGKTWQGIIKNKNKHGEPYWVDSTISPYYDEDGNHIGYFSYRIDITKEVLASEVLENYNTKLKEELDIKIQDLRQKDTELIEQSKMASLGELIANISHHWRQPLNLISISASALTYQMKFGSIDEEELKEKLEQIEHSCNELSQTISSFSEFSSLENEKSKVKIYDEVLRAKNFLVLFFEENKINLVDEIKYENNYTAKFYKNDLSKVLVNMLRNSIEALEDKKIDNKWIKLSSNENNGKLEILIEDNAGGISEENISKVFEPYFTTKFKSQGTGLGLSSSYRIVKNNIEGKLSVENSSNGAVFKIELDLC